GQEAVGAGEIADRLVREVDGEGRPTAGANGAGGHGGGAGDVGHAGPFDAPGGATVRTNGRARGGCGLATAHSNLDWLVGVEVESELPGKINNGVGEGRRVGRSQAEPGIAA